MSAQEGRRPRTGRESGDTVIGMVFALPLLVAMMLAIIDVGYNFRTRLLVTSVVRDGVRQAAADGGADNPRTSGTDWAAQIRDGLWHNGRCVLSACNGEPSVTCTPNVAANTGDQVSCSVHYRYRPVAGGLSLTITNNIVGDFDVTATGRASVGTGP